MKKIKSSIPKFESYADEARFWDSHDMVDFLDEVKEVGVKYCPRVLKEETVVVRFQSGVKKRLEELAGSRGLGLSTMIRSWTMEKLRTLL